MSNVLQNFIDGETIPLSVSTTTSSQAFILPGSWTARDVMISNAGTATAFVAFGNGSATAVLPGTNGTIGATPILAGAIVVLNKNKFTKDSDTCAAITASSATTLYFTAGQGN